MNLACVKCTSLLESNLLWIYRIRYVAFFSRVPAHIPPEVSTKIRHVYYIPPQFFPFMKKLGDDTPALKPYTDKLIRGEFTLQDYEEMFYKFAKPAKIYRKQIPLPYRTPEEVARQEEVAWEGAWLSYRQRVLAGMSSCVGRLWLIRTLSVSTRGFYLVTVVTCFCWRLTRNHSRTSPWQCPVRYATLA